jgi:hypothetical protein
MIVYAVPLGQEQPDDNDEGEEEEEEGATVVDLDGSFFDMVGSPKSATVDAAGRFVIEGLVPGTYTVTLSVMLDPSSGDRSGEKEIKVKQTVAVAREGETEITLVLDLRASR